jgi:hypothetical protein
MTRALRSYLQFALQIDPQIDNVVGRLPSPRKNEEAS